MGLAGSTQDLNPDSPFNTGQPRKHSGTGSPLTSLMSYQSHQAKADTKQRLGYLIRIFLYQAP